MYALASGSVRERSLEEITSRYQGIVDRVEPNQRPRSPAAPEHDACPMPSFKSGIVGEFSQGKHPAPET